MNRRELLELAAMVGVTAIATSAAGAESTAFHETIPGHHLQGFMTARYKP